MKLYSRGQLVFYSVMSAVAVLVLAMAIGFVRIPFSRAAGALPTALQTTTTRNVQVDSALSTPTAQPVDSSTGKYSEGELENIDIYQRLNAGVVNVTTETVGLNWFLEPVPQGSGIGSGSIIDKRGYVLTNNHVVEKAYKVTITLSDGSQYPGKVVGTDPENDLAIVKFDPGSHPLVTVPFGSSTDLKVGQKVLAIGNPFGLNRTLTTGIVSGLGRPIKADNGLVMRDMIQTDASINPGNSGGPLLDSHGVMIGINTIIFTPTGGSVGIGFAIPVETARRIVPELIKYGEVRRGWIDMVP
ncbi:MAG TPA: trypsin-like peptidase domain-containing protein, partial [Spirochaetia bacterium]|nr:trypsin-like peptidase domain-containing protein [Spirochaetia bacterium]